MIQKRSRATMPMTARSSAPSSGPSRGRDAILESFRALFGTFPDWQYIGHELLVDGDSIAQPFVVHATHVRDFMGLPGSGRKFDIQGMRLMKMRDGLIAYERRYYDFTGLLIQLGVLRGKPARPEAGGPAWTQRLRQAD